MKLTGVHHVTLTVTDIDRSAAWYRDVLGFVDRLRYRNDKVGADYQVLAHPQMAGTTLTLRQPDRSSSQPFDEGNTGMDHVAFRVGDQESFASWRTHLGHRDVPCSVTVLPELSILVLRDPDHIQIELCTTVIDSAESSIDETGRIRYS
jgi:glyoxylase I family protein